MMTVNIVFNDGTENQFTWDADTSQLGPVNDIIYLRSGYVVAVEIVSYVPKG